MITIRPSKFGVRMLLLAITLISFGTLAYAHDPQYDDQNHSYRSGYAAGFERGNMDQRDRSNFDFRQDRRYSTDSRDGYNADSRQGLNFRLGYVEGYSDGYFRNNPAIDFQSQHGRTNGHYNHNNRGYGTQDRGAVTVFTNTGFQGYSREFGIGQYPSIEGRLDDDIQSIRVNGSLQVILFEDDKFRGKRIVLNRDTWDLGEFRNKTGSMIIERIRYGQIR